MLKFFAVLLANLFLIKIAAAECPEGMVASISGKPLCYSFHSEKLDYMSAEGICMGLGGILTKINDMFENVFISEKANSNFTDSASTDFWYGSTDLLTPGKWTWFDGTPMTFTDWDVHQPSNISGNDCGAVIMHGGKWISDDCYKTKPFVCEINATSPAATTITLPVTTTHKPKTCPATWFYSKIFGFCYKVFIKQDWSGAEQFCVAAGGHLASIHSQEESDFIAGFANANAGTNGNTWEDQTWIGLFTDDNNLSWKWTDGTPFDFYLWESGEPNKQGIENCGEIWSGSTPMEGQWNNEPCDIVLPSFVCKKAPQ